MASAAGSRCWGFRNCNPAFAWQSRGTFPAIVFHAPEPIRVKSLGDLDALVGERVMRETPEVYWEDSHGYFQFHSEVEARQALADPYYQKFLPPVDWSRTVVREVRIYGRYSSEPGANWRLAEEAIAQFGPMLIWREVGRWHAAFGTFPDAEARAPMIALCLAALSAAGIRCHVDHDALDAGLGELQAGRGTGQAA